MSTDKLSQTEIAEIMAVMPIDRIDFGNSYVTIEAV